MNTTYSGEINYNVSELNNWFSKFDIFSCLWLNCDAGTVPGLRYMRQSLLNSVLTNCFFILLRDWKDKQKFCSCSKQKSIRLNLVFRLNFLAPTFLCLFTLVWLFMVEQIARAEKTVLFCYSDKNIRRLVANIII